MAAKKKSTYIQGPMISVVKRKWCYYKSKRLSLGYLKDLGVTLGQIEIVRGKMGVMRSPEGVYGGHVTNEKSVTDFLTRLGLKEKLISFKTRYHITDNDAITSDETPKTGLIYEYSKSKGFPNRMLANAEAITRYEWFCRICVDASNKPSQPVRLVLHDKEGNVTKKRFNGFKPKTK